METVVTRASSLGSGWRNASTTSAASSSPVPMPSLPTYRATANSSPPIRATTSVGLVTDSSRWAASRSTRSPVW